MIQFPTLLQAVEYIRGCPLCQERLAFKEDVDVYHHRYPVTHTWEIETTLIFTDSNPSYSDKIKICLQTDKVERETETYKETVSSNITSSIPGGYYSYTYPPSMGYKYLSLGMECPHCRNYNFMIQIVVDLEPRKIARILLNSELLIFRDKDNAYEVRNIYTTSQTEYTCYPEARPRSGKVLTSMSSKQQTLPLIPLDRDKPHHFLQRVRKLLLWV
jgi:hypothetical protein